jgi:23S rRNA (adenine-N6)-dimethyltransferase
MASVLSHSQNYFRYHTTVQALVDKAEITDQDTVVEIGPGKGIITRELSARAKKVIAVEVDPRLYRGLSEKLRGLDNVELIQADFVTWELPTEPYKVFANIPFNMTADIVGKLISDANSPTLAYLIMQDKAAERYVGHPLSQDTQVSILIKSEFEVSIVSRISRQEFAPTPQVGVVLTLFRKRDKPLVDANDRQGFRDFVIYTYNQWKPSVLDSLAKLFSYEQRQKLAKQVGAHTKPRELKVEQWVSLFETYMLYVSDEKKALVVGAERRLKLQQAKLQKIHRTR